MRQALKIQIKKIGHSTFLTRTTGKVNGIEIVAKTQSWHAHCEKLTYWSVFKSLNVYRADGFGGSSLSGSLTKKVAEFVLAKLQEVSILRDGRQDWNGEGLEELL